MKRILCLVVLLVPALSFVGQIVSGDVETDLPVEIPASVRTLLEWPTAEATAGKSESSTATTVRAAVSQAEDWLQKVLEEKWLPTKLDPICLRDEFDDRDTVRYKWIQANREFVVAQTRSIFALEVRPETGALRGSSKDGLLDSARRLAREILAKTGIRRVGWEEVPILEFDRVIAEWSFDAERAKEVAAQASSGLRLLGKPKPMPVHPFKRQDGSIMEGVFGRKLPYWYEIIYWYADTQRLILYFLKDEGGPLYMSFKSTKMDVGWFKE